MARKPAASTRAALGLRAHTGWAAMVVLGGPAGAPQVLDRQRLTLEDPTGRVPRFVYHLAADVGAAKGAPLVEAARAAAETAARAAIGETIERMRQQGITVGAGVVLTGTAPAPEDLEAILAAHTLIHAAEGALYRAALIDGCRHNGLKTITVRERDLWAKAQATLGRGEAAVEQALQALGKAAGRPWAQDQRMAAAAAWIALK